jgi:ABC-type transporter Mla subunit MlaD
MKFLLFITLIGTFMLACNSQTNKETIAEPIAPVVEEANDEVDEVIAPIETAIDELNQKTDELNNDLDSLINVI